MGHYSFNKIGIHVSIVMEINEGMIEGEKDLFIEECQLIKMERFFHSSFGNLHKGGWFKSMDTKASSWKFDEEQNID